MSESPRWALVSVYDKTGVIDLAQRLVALGWEIISSGGTSAALADAGIPVTPVEQVTGAPEMLDGRGQDRSSRDSRGTIGRPVQTRSCERPG